MKFNDYYKKLTSNSISKFLEEEEKRKRFFQPDFETIHNSIPDINNLFETELNKIKKALYPSIVFEEYSKSLLEQSEIIKNTDFQFLLERELTSTIKTEYALSSLNDENSLQAILRSLSPSQQILGILDRWKKDMEVIGHFEVRPTIIDSEQYTSIYDIDEDTQIVNADGSDLILPDTVKSRLITVENLPIKTIQRIFENPELMRQISPREFEYFIAHLVEGMEFNNIIVTPRSNDGGQDIVATKEINGIPLIFAFECKQYSPDNKIQLDTLRALLGSVSHGRTKANIGVLVTTSYFTQGDRDFILSEASIDGKDFDDVVNWINDLKSSQK